MYKVLIVDDEIGIREGLEYLIDWEEFGAAIIGAASNGQEALEAIRAHKPDIMIADIRMPVMDGLALMKEIHQLGLPIRVIVLSGYDEFTYVREAMKYGAENYLLKPVDGEELSNSVKEIVKNLDDKRFVEIKNRESIQILKNNTLSRIVRNDISFKEYVEKTEFLNIDLNFEFMQVAVIELGLAYDAVEQHSENQWKKFASMNICEEITANYSNALVFTDPSDHIVILFREPNLGSICETQIRRLLSECMDQINRILHIHCFSSVGSAVSSHRELGLSYRQAISFLDYKLALGLDKTAFYTNSTSNTSIQGSLLTIDTERLKDLIRTRNKTELMAYVRTIFGSYDEGDPFTPTQIRDLLIEIVIAILNVTREFQADGRRIIDLNEFTLKLHSTKNLMEMLDEIEKIVGNSITHIQHVTEKRYSKIVQDAIDYVKENYFSPDISLKTLSVLIGVNAAYLGRAFKEETGEFFSDYLMKLRIERAKHLLNTSSLKVSEISSRIGLLNSNYFYTLFKKHTGMNPGDFRQV